MNPKNFKSTKRFTGFPCTHRQWRAESHCRFVHGYSREFYFEFTATELTKEGWVVDFGGLKEIKNWLDHMFGHTFLVSEGAGRFLGLIFSRTSDRFEGKRSSDGRYIP